MGSGSKYCRDHTCQAPSGCKTETSSRFPFCDAHTCQRSVDCRTAKEPECRYCDKHLCPGCNEVKSSTTTYCDQCQRKPSCQRSGCDETQGSDQYNERLSSRKRDAPYCGNHCCEADGCYKEKSSSVSYCSAHTRKTTNRTWRPRVDEIAVLKCDKYEQNRNGSRGIKVKKGTGGRVHEIKSAGEYVVRFTNVDYMDRRGKKRQCSVTMSVKLEEIEKATRRRLANTVSHTPLQELENLIIRQ